MQLTYHFKSIVTFSIFPVAGRAGRCDRRQPRPRRRADGEAAGPLRARARPRRHGARADRRDRGGGRPGDGRRGAPTTRRSPPSAALADDSHLVVSDTSWEGYETIPGWVIDGYATIGLEVDEQLRAPRARGARRRHRAGRRRRLRKRRRAPLPAAGRGDRQRRADEGRLR